MSSEWVPRWRARRAAKGVADTGLVVWQCGRTNAGWGGDVVAEAVGEAKAYEDDEHVHQKQHQCDI
jgi:hypothetical protein